VGADRWHHRLLVLDEGQACVCCCKDTCRHNIPDAGVPVVHLDAGYDYQPCRQVLTKRGMVGEIATRGVPAPIQAGRRWVIERTHAWGNQYGKLRWCTERRRLVVEFWLALANAAIVLGRLVRRAWVSYRWEGRPRRRPRPPTGAGS